MRLFKWCDLKIAQQLLDKNVPGAVWKHGKPDEDGEVKYTALNLPNPLGR
jgi:hypothetical protein